MANEIKLEVYTIRIKESYKEGYLSLDSFFEKNDFFSFFSELMTSLSKDMSINEYFKKSLQFKSETSSIDSGNRIISGIIDSGDYGTESSIVNQKTKEEVYHKTEEDLEVKPFYFLIHSPKDFDMGFLVLQRLGSFGIQTIFTRTVIDLFKQKYSNYIIEFSPFASKKLAQDLLNKKSITELKLKRNNLPPDVANKLNLKGHEKDIQFIEIRIVSKRGKYLDYNDKVKKFVNNSNAAFFEINEMDKLGFDGKSTSSIKVDIGGSSRTIDLNDSFQFRPYFDIHNEVDKSKGNPVFSSIDKISKKLIKDIYKEIKS